MPLACHLDTVIHLFKSSSVSCMSVILSSVAARLGHPLPSLPLTQEPDPGQDLPPGLGSWMLTCLVQAWEGMSLYFPQAKAGLRLS